MRIHISIPCFSTVLLEFLLDTLTEPELAFDCRCPVRAVLESRAAAIELAGAS